MAAAQHDARTSVYEYRDTRPAGRDDARDGEAHPRRGYLVHGCS